MRPGGPSPRPQGEGSTGRRRLEDAALCSGGGGATARGPGRGGLLPLLAASRRAKDGSWVGRITGDTGKSADEERVAEGIIVCAWQFVFQAGTSSAPPEATGG